MLVTNPYLTSLKLYADYINKLNNSNYSFKSDYKTYDENGDYYILFSCFDIKSDIRFSSNLVFKNIVYNGYLKFDYHKSTHEIYIRQLPSINGSKCSFQVFTSDLANIILKTINKYYDDKITIIFDDKLLIFVIDNKVDKLIPSVKNTIQYKRFINICDEIQKEEEHIVKKIKQYKERIDRRDRKIEIAASKKRSIYGIDPNNYDDYEKLKKEINKKLAEIWNKKIANIERHLNSNKNKYKELLKEFYGNDLEFAYQLIFEYSDDIPNDEVISDKILESDLKNTKGIIQCIEYVQKQYLQYRNKEDDSRILWNSKEQFYYFIRIMIHNYSVNKHFSDYGYTFSYGKNIDNEFKYSSIPAIYYPYEHKNPQLFKSLIDTIIQIKKLNDRLKYYRNISCDPDNAIMNFTSINNSWGSINQLPYWLKIDWQKVSQRADNRINLLMIKPGINNLDLNSLHIFSNLDTLARNNAEKLELSTDITNNKDEYFDCLITTVTIPSSLSIADINKVIEFAYKYSRRKIQFICEDITTSVYLKRYICLKEMNVMKDGKHYYEKDNKSYYLSESYRTSIKEQKKQYRAKKNTLDFVVEVIPNYYNLFLTTTPNNENIFNVLCKEAYGIDAQVYRYQTNIISEFKRVKYLVDEYFDGNSIIFEELLFGDYFSKEHKYINETIRNLLLKEAQDKEENKAVKNLTENEVAYQFVHRYVDSSKGLPF